MGPYLSSDAISHKDAQSIMSTSVYFTIYILNISQRSHVLQAEMIESSVPGSKE